MKKILVLFSLIWCFPSISIADTITLVADKWCPYTCSPKTVQPGYVVEISRIVHEKAGHKLLYKLVPWPRAVKEARNGKYNGIIGFTKKDVEGFINTENEVGIAQDAFFVKSGESWKYRELSSLKEIEVVGYPNGYHYTPEIDKYFQKANNVDVIPGDNPIKPMVKMLLKGRINTFPENEMVVKYFLKQTNQTDKLAIAGEFNRSNVYVGFGLNSPTHQRDMKILSDGIQMLRTTGELDKILDRYGIKDWR
ncbi:transporter substrate-binding domain-containing protein [bacterium]|nr:transporter substrate-binding domain-containing protein [bacterium]